MAPGEPIPGERGFTMNLNKLNLEVAKAASKETGRYNLNSIHFTKDYTESSNGHIMARVTYPEQFDPSEVPDLIKTGKKEDIQEFMIPADSLKGVKFPKKISLPVLKDLYVDVESTNSNGSAKFGMTDLETTIQPEIRKMEGEYPNVNACIPTSEPIFEVSLDGRYLAMMATIAAQFQERTGEITLHFHSFTSPVVITAFNESQKFKGLIMPMRGAARDLTKKDEPNNEG